MSRGCRCWPIKGVAWTALPMTSKNVMVGIYILNLVRMTVDEIGAIGPRKKCSIKKSCCSSRSRSRCLDAFERLRVMPDDDIYVFSSRKAITF